MSKVGIVFASIGGFVGFLALIFVLNLFGFGNYAFFQPKVVAVQNKTFHESQQYTDGMRRDLENLRMAYIHASDPLEKQAIRATIQQRFAGYDEDGLSPDLRSFYESVR